ncbi:MAG: formylglycine-generating enzyme family protein, partial [Planctomycetota bacterium]
GKIVEDRARLRELYAGKDDHPESAPRIRPRDIVPLMPEPVTRAQTPKAPADWPLSFTQAQRLQKDAGGDIETTVDLGKGVTLRLVRIPQGAFVMGDEQGYADEAPAVQQIDRPFWIGAFEVTNQQLRRFDVAHRSGYFNKRFATKDGPGLNLDGASQPAVRVSWQKADAFCRWLTERTGATFRLPTEAEWEYACRAGSPGPFFYGGLDDDFSPFANLADHSLALPTRLTGGLTTSLTNPDPMRVKGILMEAQRGVTPPFETRYDDTAIATAPVGGYRPNAWGLYDTHGNVAEWTAPSDTPSRVALRGGSWVDHPRRARAAYRLTYPAWQAVHNAGFRVVMEIDTPATTKSVSEE